jgi:Na+:H+ antiporter, NhaA family
VRTLEVVVRRLLSPSQRLERDLQAWSSYLVLPLFALANADIPLSAGALGLLHSISLAVFLGLVIAKPLDITLGARITVRTSLASKPEDIARRQLAGAGVLCGIGFTMFFYRRRRLHQSRNILVLAKLGVMLGCRPGRPGGLYCAARRASIPTTERHVSRLWQRGNESINPRRTCAKLAGAWPN